jgi:hypothetical protein
MQPAPTAAAAAAAGPVDSAGQPLLPPAAVWRDLEADVDQWIKLSSIGFLINFNELVAAGSTHFVRREGVHNSHGGGMHGCTDCLHTAVMFHTTAAT